MKYIYLLTIIIACLFSLNTYSQPSFDWVAPYGGSSSDHPNSITTDDSGNVFIVGAFNTTVDFDPSPNTMNLTSTGFFDMYVQKLDSNGNLLWVKQFGSVNNVDGDEIITDSLGNIYISGRFDGTVDFDPGPLNAFKSSTGGYDAFVLKLDINGDFLWVKTINANTTLSGESIGLDINGNIYITGRFNGTADFDPGAAVYTITSTNGGLNGNAYVLKLTNNGDFVWAKSFGGASGGGDGYELIVGIDEYIFVGGVFSGTVDFDPGPSVMNRTSAGAGDSYIVKLDSNGMFIWVSAYGGAGTEYLKGISEDYRGNIIATGYFNGTTDFDSGSGTNNITSNGQNDAYIIKLDQNGIHTWANGIGGSFNDYGNDIDVDRYGNIYVTGYYQATVDFDPSASTANSTSNGSLDVFLLKLNSYGELIFIESFGGTGAEEGATLDVNNRFDIFIAGSYHNTVDFDSGVGITQSTSNAWQDIYVSKYKQCTPSDTSISIVACDTYNSPSGNYIWTNSGQYIDQLIGANINGCDSVIFINLTIESEYLFNQIESICQGDSLEIYGVYQTVAGMYYDSLQTVMGCDSVFSTNLIVNPLPNVILSEFNPDTLCLKSGVVSLPTGTPNGGIYSGIGVVGNNFYPSISGDGTFDVFYSYTDMNSCTNIDSTQITVISCVGAKELTNNGTDFLIYPNPTKGGLSITLNNEYSGFLKVINLLGEIVLEAGFESQSELNLMINSPPGIYFIELSIDDRIIVKKITKN